MSAACFLIAVGLVFAIASLPLDPASRSWLGGGAILLMLAGALLLWKALAYGPTKRERVFNSNLTSIPLTEEQFMRFSTEAAGRSGTRKRRRWVWLIGGITSFLTYVRLGSELRSLSFPWFPVYTGLFWGLAYYCVRYVSDFVTASSFRSVMNEHGYEVCIACGYDLRGITSDRCPECGKEREREMKRAGDGETQ